MGSFGHGGIGSVDSVEGAEGVGECAHGVNKMERPRGVNLIYSGGGDPLCTITLHRAEGLYG